MKLLFYSITLVVLINTISAEKVQTVDQTQLQKLITEKQYVVALFCPSSALNSCQQFESELISIEEDMLEVMRGGRVVKLMDSPMVEEYALEKLDQPVIIMFRNGSPVLYDGSADADDLLNTLVRYMVQSVQELTDSSFEHLTQAASGATTGDWLVMFFTPSCQLCHKLTATLETVACKHQGRSSVARVNKEAGGEKTAKRFELGMGNFPDIILFRRGRMYRYQVLKYDLGSLQSFIYSFYKNYPAEAIPPPLSPFDELVQLCVDYLKAYPALVGTGTQEAVVGTVVAVVLLLIFLLCWKEGQEPEDQQEEDKEEDDTEQSKKDD